jgi:hypothetical protein
MRRRREREAEGRQLQSRYMLSLIQFGSDNSTASTLASKTMTAAGMQNNILAIEDERPRWWRKR